MLIALPAPVARRVLPILGLAALLALSTCAQAQSGQQQPQFSLQMQVPLVVEDIVVLDNHNQPVHGLTAADFTVTDDGKTISPGNFEEYAAPAPVPQPAVSESAVPQLAAENVRLFTNRNAPPAGAPLNVLLLDALNTPTLAQANARRQMLQYLASVPSGAPIAIYGLGARLYLIQGFTTDTSALKAALTARRNGPQASPLLDSSASGGPGTQADALDADLLLTGDTGMQMFLQGDIDTDTSTMRTQRTIEAFAQLARYLSILPGRKNLIWFSGSFPLNITPTGLQVAAAMSAASNVNSSATLSSSMFSNSGSAHFGDAVRSMDNQLRRSQIAIYPIDARGLVTDSSMDASSNIHAGTLMTSQEANAMLGGARVQVGGSASVTEPMDTVSNFSAKLFEEHNTMNQMAEETGGKAFYNNGDLKAALQSALSLGSNYYSISYTPPSGSWDGKFHKITVKVNRPDLHLTYRKGYYADNLSQDSHGHPLPQPSAMQSAMLHGAPDPSGLLFDVSATVADDTTGQLAPGSRPDTKLMQPPYRTCTLTARLDIHNLTLPANASGAHEGNIVFAMVVYDANGNVVNQAARTGHLALPPDRYAQLLESGLAIRQSIEVPVKGSYFLRVGFSDPASEHVGAVEIPVAALGPAPIAAQAPGQNPPTHP